MSRLTARLLLAGIIGLMVTGALFWPTVAIIALVKIW